MVCAMGAANTNHIIFLYSTYSAIDSLFSHKHVCDVLAKSRRIVGHLKQAITASKLLKEYHK
ncbi:hypothetical protein PR048_009103 [Dryococelus australis]|uniref:Uncharacterized protein n=1 Tax=Dryococelus australis TaxID=614101 RepID=A0ABQ9HYZ2_9NEOP|nr:hypothetical protein PR048_009103 [Dryococelus australis]